MKPTGYYWIEDQQLVYHKALPAGIKPLKHNLGLFLPPLISKLHASFHLWGELGYSPGPLSDRKVYFDEQGRLAFGFSEKEQPHPLPQVGVGPDLAAWLVLLDKWMETYVVIARARMMWNLYELASALSFLTPAFLPAKLVAHPPDNWERVAIALAIAVADGAVGGAPTNQHWQSQSKSG